MARLPACNAPKPCAWGHTAALHCRPNAPCITLAAVHMHGILPPSPDASQLAEVVGSGSGLNRWREEAAKANEELVATRRALADIRANLIKLVRQR